MKSTMTDYLQMLLRRKFDCLKLRDMTWNKMLRINILFAQVTLVLHRCSLVSCENVSIKSVECRIVKANEYMENIKEWHTDHFGDSYIPPRNTQNIIVQVVVTWGHFQPMRGEIQHRKSWKTKKTGVLIFFLIFLCSNLPRMGWKWLHIATTRNYYNLSIAWLKFPKF